MIVNVISESLECLERLSGWWFQPLSKILVSWDDFPIYGKIKNVPNHQAVLE